MAPAGPLQEAEGWKSQENWLTGKLSLGLSRAGHHYLLKGPGVSGRLGKAHESCSGDCPKRGTLHITVPLPTSNFSPSTFHLHFPLGKPSTNPGAQCGEQGAVSRVQSADRGQAGETKIREIVVEKSMGKSQPKHTSVFMPSVSMVLIVFCTKLTGFQSPTCLTCDDATVPFSDGLRTVCCAWELGFGMLSFSVSIRLK